MGPGVRRGDGEGSGVGGKTLPFRQRNNRFQPASWQFPAEIF
jgi:hypothetical protein